MPDKKQAQNYEVPTGELSPEETVKRYKMRLAWAKNAQQGMRDEASENILYYENRPPIYTESDQKVAVPIGLRNVDAMYAALTAFNVSPVVVPRGTTTYEVAQAQTELLKAEWEDEEVVSFGNYGIKDALICKIGFTKVVLDYADEEDEDEEGNPVQRVLRDNVTVEHVPYDELFWDPEAKKWEDVRWVCQLYEIPLEEAKANDTWNAAARNELKPDRYINEGWRKSYTGSLTKGYDSDEERVCIYVMHDLVTGYNTTFSETTSIPLSVVENPFATRPVMRKRNPYVRYIVRSKPGFVEGISEIDAMKRNIDEENVIRSDIATFVNRFKPKLIGKEGAVTESGKLALSSQEWGALVEVEGTSALSDAVLPLPPPNLPQEAFVQDAKAQDDADSAIGLNELLQAQLPAGRKTATAMQQLSNATTVRQSEKRNRLEQYWRDIAERMLFLMITFYDKERIVRIVGDVGDTALEFNADDIAFETALQIEIEPKEVLDTQAKQEKLFAIWNIAGMDPEVNGLELKRYVLESLGLPREVIRRILKTPEEQQAEAQASQESRLQEELALQAAQNMPQGNGLPGTDIGTALLE